MLYMPEGKPDCYYQLLFYEKRFLFFFFSFLFFFLNDKDTGTLNTTPVPV